MSVQIVAHREMKLVGYRVVGRRQELSHRAPLAWLELMRGLDAIANRVDDDLFYGVFIESELDGDGHYRYWVTTEVSAFGPRPAEMVELTIPAGDFAMATALGGPEQIDEAYIALSRAIAERGGPLPPGEHHGFERYDVRRQRPTPPYERFDYDIFRPIVGG